jgi:spore germination cell wall hydrolase CwlJ-like protein
MRYFTKIVYSFIFLLLVPSSAHALEELEFRSFLDKQLVCMAEAIYFESRGEPFTGQLAVGQVILQRVASPSFPDDVCSVVHQGKYHRSGHPVKHKCEFSYWCDGKPEEIDDPVAYHESISAASLVSEGVQILSVKKALHYHAIYVRPFWADKYKRLAQIGKHIFYSRERSN